MVMSIRTNVASLNAQRNLTSTQMQLDSSLAKLSSGFRITKAGDDAAGLSISTNLEAQIRSYNQAARNANDGISVIQVAESSMNEQANILTRLRELAMQAASDGVGDTERGYINTEKTQLLSEVDRIANASEFNGTNVLNTSATVLDFQVGIRNSAANDRISVTTVNAKASALLNTASTQTLSLSTKADAQTALSTIDAALQKLSDSRARLGAAGNRFNNALGSIQNASEALSAANSRIRDVDVAEETSRMARSQVLMQAGVSVLAQANQMPQIALKLLG
jgi:flagellin